VGKIKRKVLVTGYCRSGTTTIGRFLRDAGLKVRHENMGEDGTSSCFFFIDAPRYPLGGAFDSHVNDGTFKDYEFENIIHLVRNPLKAIASQAKMYSKAHKQWLEDIGFVNVNIKPNVLHAAKFWVAVNRHVGKMTRFRIRIEDLAEEWPRIKRKLKLKVDMPEVRHMNKASGIRIPKVLTYEDLFDLEPKTAREVKALAKRYGYEIDKS